VSSPGTANSVGYRRTAARNDESIGVDLVTETMPATGRTTNASNE
jgi:hypothetical protein